MRLGPMTVSSRSYNQIGNERILTADDRLPLTMTSPTRTPSSSYPGARQIPGRNKANGGAGYYPKATRYFLPILKLVDVETGHPTADAAMAERPEATIVADLLLPRASTSHLPNIPLKPAKLLKLSAKRDSRPRRERGDQRLSRTRRTKRASPLALPGIDTKELVLS